jgi:transcription initiation factor IIE alpha subunit
MGCEMLQSGLTVQFECQRCHAKTSLEADVGLPFACRVCHTDWLIFDNRNVAISFEIQVDEVAVPAKTVNGRHPVYARAKAA